MRLRTMLRPLVMVVLAAVLVSSIPSTVWADPTLPPGWLDKAIKRHAVVADNGAQLRFMATATAAQGDVGRSRKSKVLLGIGIGLAAAGGVMAAAGGEPTEIGESGVGIDWRTTGYIWMGAGAALAIWGLVSK